MRFLQLPASLAILCLPVAVTAQPLLLPRAIPGADLNGKSGVVELSRHSLHTREIPAFIRNRLSTIVDSFGNRRLDLPPQGEATVQGDEGGGGGGYTRQEQHRRLQDFYRNIHPPRWSGRVVPAGQSVDEILDAYERSPSSVENQIALDWWRIWNFHCVGEEIVSTNVQYIVTIRFQAVRKDNSFINLLIHSFPFIHPTNQSVSHSSTY